MSELKAFDIVVAEEGYCEGIVKYRRAVYDKSEADKAIAELKDNLGTVNQIVKASRELLLESQKMHKRCAENAAKIIRHQKYKRCLAMARCCNRMLSSTFGKERYWQKWNRRWLELAEKFKEAK